MENFRKPLVQSILIVFILSLFSNQFYQSAITPLSLTGAEKQQILSSTIQILVFPVQGIEYERGLGTLIRYGSGTFILTHNHWEMLSTTGKVEFRDDQNRTLLMISGTEFLELICYRDRGSIVLITPSALSTTEAVVIDDFPMPSEGDVVTLVHHHKDDYRLDTMTVKVVRVITDKGTATFDIVPPKEKEIILGDSGGGLWYEGKLVGNMWAFYIEEKKGLLNLAPLKEIQIGIVAQLPINYLQTYQGLTSNQPYTDEREEKE